MEIKVLIVYHLSKFYYSIKHLKKVNLRYIDNQNQNKLISLKGWIIYKIHKVKSSELFNFKLHYLLRKHSKIKKVHEPFAEIVLNFSNKKFRFKVMYLYKN